MNLSSRVRGCETLSPSDCENSSVCLFFGSCSGTPWNPRTAAEGEALLSLEAAANDPNYDYEYDYDPYGDAPDALPNANDSVNIHTHSGSGSTRTNLRGWNQDQEQELQ